ncbi:MAG TPA: PQQ-binding-like beta-propeller repeat protein [Microbacteriaceae bacterium]
MTVRRRDALFAIAASIALVVTGAATAFAAGVPGAPFDGFVGVQSVGAASGSGVVAQAATLRVTGAPGDARSGGFRMGQKIAWRVTAPDVGLDGTQGLSFVAGDDKVWVAGGVKDDSEASGGSRFLVGLDTQTGSMKWQTRIGGLEDHQLVCAPETLAGAAACAFGPSAGPGPADPIILELIRLADGRVMKHATLAQLGIAADYVPDVIHVFGQSVVVRAMTSTQMGEPTAGSAARIRGDLSSTMWQTPISNICNGGSGWPTVAHEGGDVLAISDAEAQAAFDFSTGKLLANPRCQTLDVFGTDGIVADASNYDAVPDSATTVANGHVVTLVSAGDFGTHSSVVNFSSSGKTAPLPLLYSADGDAVDGAAVAANAFDPKTKTTIWKSSVTGTYTGMRSGFFGAYNGSSLVLVDPSGHVTSVVPATGAVKWANSYPAPARGESEAGATQPRPMFANDGVVLVPDIDSGDNGSGHSIINAFDPGTGVKLWEIDDASILAQPSSLGGDAIPVSTGARNGSDIAALVPASSAGPTTAAGTLPALPQGLPTCPAGMTPISWSSFPRGHVLVCNGSRGYTVDYSRNHQSIQCSALAFVGSTFTLTCAHNERVLVTGGGALVQVSSASVSVIQPASVLRSASGGNATTGFVAASTSIPRTCPAGSTPISVSTWRGGWLLICGTDALHATSFTFADPTGSGAGTGMTYVDGRYCGSTGAGVQVCANASPALVTLTPKGGVGTQRSATPNYFAANGSGGSGKGTGAYNVAAPANTANDQVRYLVQILQKSQTGRAQISDLVQQLLRCSVGSAELATASSVVANRHELVTALQSTPFDTVPGGARLIVELSQALQVSLQADQQYQTAAQQMAGGDCATGQATMKSAIAVANTTDALKQTFVDDWNANIAGHYADARTFSGDSI